LVHVGSLGWLETDTSAKKIVGYYIWQNGIVRVRRGGRFRRDGEPEGGFGGGWGRQNTM